MHDAKLTKDMQDFEAQLTRLINFHSLERLVGMPDFIISGYLMACLRTFSITINTSKSLAHSGKERKE